LKEEQKSFGVLSEEQVKKLKAIFDDIDYMKQKFITIDKA
jgi:hypothetical protein